MHGMAGFDGAACVDEPKRPGRGQCQPCCRRRIDRPERNSVLSARLSWPVLRRWSRPGLGVEERRRSMGRRSQHHPGLVRVVRGTQVGVAPECSRPTIGAGQRPRWPGAVHIRTGCPGFTATTQRRHRRSRWCPRPSAPRRGPGTGTERSRLASARRQVLGVVLACGGCAGGATTTLHTWRGLDPGRCPRRSSGSATSQRMAFLSALTQ
jgi:hypothetical protein